MGVMLIALMLVGCNSAQTGGLLGGGLGAAAGAGIDHRNRGRGALIGAGVGSVLGYIFGNEMDKSRAQITSAPPAYGSAGYNGGYERSGYGHTTTRTRTTYSRDVLDSSGAVIGKSTVNEDSYQRRPGGATENVTRHGSARTRN